MKKFFNYAVVNLSILLFSYGANASCYIYENNDQSGYRLKMESGTYISNFEDVLMKQSLWDKPNNSWIGENITFNDKASSILVNEGCALKLYSDSNQEGRLAEFNTHFRDGDLKINLEKYEFNDKLSSAYCSCYNGFVKTYNEEN